MQSSRLRIAVLPAFVAFLTLPLQAQQAAGPPAQIKIVEIDGKKNPELIPDHVVWTKVFKFLSSRSNMPQASVDTIKHELKSLSDHELSMIFAAADLYLAIEKSFQARI